MAKLTPKQRLDNLLKRKNIDIKNVKNYDELLKLVEASIIHKKFNWQSLNKYIIETFARDNREGDLVELYQKISDLGTSLTQTKFILIYGDVEGNKRWKSYCDKQALTNTFEYKKEKYGMSEEEFKEYNKSRSVTLENLVKRHGEEIGKKKWEAYCERQSYAGCKLEYFVELYGEEEGTKKWLGVNSKKSLNLDNFVRLYGEEGEQKCIEHWSRMRAPYSKVSQELFSRIDEKIGDSYGTLYYQTKNQEFGRLDVNTQYYFYDFAIPDKKLIIEFNGDLYHANPTIYSETDVPKFRGNKKTAKELWEKDERKTKFAESLGFRVIIVWEKDYYADKDGVVERIINEINSI